MYAWRDKGHKALYPLSKELKKGDTRERNGTNTHIRAHTLRAPTAKGTQPHGFGQKAKFPP
jgi:hypothetical protein